MEIILLALLLLALDAAVLWAIHKSKAPQMEKLLFSFIVIVVPILGISIYYLFRKR